MTEVKSVHGVKNHTRTEGRMKIRPLLVMAALLMCASTILLSQTKPSHLKIEAVHATEPINIDGILTESVWQRPGVDGFLQRDPNEGTPASERTEVWIAYDDEALYVAARMYDPAPDSIMNFLARRDQMPTTDYFAFFVDPYFDHRTGYYFVVSAGGSLGDGTLYNDDWDDDSWDGVWEAEARIDDLGWTVEMRIPFSQLLLCTSENRVPERMGGPLGDDSDGADSSGLFGSLLCSGRFGLDRGVVSLLEKNSDPHGGCCEQQKHQNQDVLVQNDSFCTFVSSTLVIDCAAPACPRTMCHMSTWR